MAIPPIPALSHAVLAAWGPHWSVHDCLAKDKARPVC